jgi:O-succinylbenzoic acid--CoA ligase
MHDWLASRAATTPDATALVDAESGATRDFATLDAEVTALAERLAAVGVAPGDRAAAVLSPSVDAVRLVHAAVRLGVTLAPLNERSTAAELRSLVDCVDPSRLVCDASTETRAVDAAGGAPVVSVDSSDREAVRPLPATSGESLPTVDRSLDDVRLLMFTSGTTGRPKAVQLTTGNLLASAVASAFRLGFDPADRWLVALSPCHMGGISPLLRMPLYGMAVVLRPDFDARAVAADVEAHGVTCVSLVPTMLGRLLDSGAGATLGERLRVVLLGGAPATDSLLDRAFAADVPVFPTYGMTETASQIATARPAEAAANPGTVGRPLLWTDLSVRDEAGEPLPTGEAGELVVDGPTVTPGYFRNEAANEAAFGPHGLRTGDVGYRDEAGRVWVLDRVDDRIVTGGENVDPGEVAAAIREVPGVDDAVVVGLPDDEWGERVAALVAADGATEADVEAHCRERLAGFKRPKALRFVDALPRTASGTVERERVRDLLSDGGDPA